MMRAPRLMVRVGQFFVNKTRVLEVHVDGNTITINFDTGKSEVVTFESEKELEDTLDELTM